MTLNTAERESIRALPKRIDMCPKLQEAKDKSLRAALLAEFKSDEEAERARFESLYVREQQRTDATGRYTDLIVQQRFEGWMMCAKFNDTAIADRVMRVIKEQR